MPGYPIGARTFAVDLHRSQLSLHASVEEVAMLLAQQVRNVALKVVLDVVTNTLTALILFSTQPSFRRAQTSILEAGRSILGLDVRNQYRLIT